LALRLSSPPADLSQLARNNGGVFPERAIERIVTSGIAVPAHGEVDMPIWGEIFQALDPADVRVKARIRNVVAYIESLQDSPKAELLPVSTSLSGGVDIYITRPGDTVASVAGSFGLDAVTLARQNGIRSETRLGAGAVLIVDTRRIVPVPASAGTAAPVELAIVHGRVFVEVHDDPAIGRMSVTDVLLDTLERIGAIDFVRPEAIERAVRERDGLAHDVTLAPFGIAEGSAE
jgi:hypothetical protein